jgi:hypothetical protein
VLCGISSTLFLTLEPGSGARAVSSGCIRGIVERRPTTAGRHLTQPVWWLPHVAQFALVRARIIRGSRTQAPAAADLVHGSTRDSRAGRKSAGSIRTADVANVD